MLESSSSHPNVFVRTLNKDTPGFVSLAFFVFSSGSPSLELLCNSGVDSVASLYLDELGSAVTVKYKIDQNCFVL